MDDKNDLPLSRRMREESDPIKMVRRVWEESTKNGFAMHYITAVLDTLLWCRQINIKTYEKYISVKWKGELPEED